MAHDELRIGSRSIGRRHRPFITAEMSGNHNRSLERALAIVDAAADAGAHALKIQTYTADTMTLDLNEREFRIDDPNSLWYGDSLYSLYEKAHTPWEWHEPIFERCRARGIEPFSTPFDHTAVDFLEKLGVAAYKIASFENTDLPLLRKVASTGKPMIISTGMASLEELHETVRTVRRSGCEEIILLKCTSSYPASPENSNLRTIEDIRNRFGVQVGLSDHTGGIGAALAAVALGATFIEKHVTLDRSDGGVDSAFSLEPDELSALVNESERAWLALGEVRYGVSQSEIGSMQFRRSLYVTENVKRGELMSERNIRSIRPGYGLPPRHYEAIIGRRAACDITRGTALRWDLVSKE